MVGGHHFIDDVNGGADQIISQPVQVSVSLSYKQGEDVVPEPKIIIAAMKACRRLNDYAVAVRYLEAVKVCEWRRSRYVTGGGQGV